MHSSNLKRTLMMRKMMTMTTMRMMVKRILWKRKRVNSTISLMSKAY
jgi:hypothetical protein